MPIPPALQEPPVEFTLAPFWFLNDELREDELLRQLDDFQAHGVHGFVVHPRVGLPRHQGWMSEELLGYYELLLEQARQRGMLVWLYDEGMYPSGSSCGQVVAENPAWQARCLVPQELADDQPPTLPEGQHLVAVLERAAGGHVAVIDRPADAYIRGLHFLNEGGDEEDEPPAADLLNPEASLAFRRLVYERFAERFGRYFNDPIQGIFTDEANPCGKNRTTPYAPGSRAVLEAVNAKLGYDFTPHLPALWYDDEPDAQHYRHDYAWAIHQRMIEVYYRPLSEFCAAHGIALTGHPSASDDIGTNRLFHVPGQDLVWREVVPGPTALEGAGSTQPKTTSSVQLHMRRRRNANECCGAYGHELTWEEMCWLADWCFVRGVNLLFPHAFYYSVRGPRRDERPPDVGPNSPWWDRYKQYADYCRRMAWLNTDSGHICRVAILCPPHAAPWRVAKVLFENQVDFNYLDTDDLANGTARVSADGLRIAEMHYDVVIADGPLAPGTNLAPLTPLLEQQRLLAWCPEGEAAGVPNARACGDAEALLQAIRAHVSPDVACQPAAPALRVRHVVKDGEHYYIFFNEGTEPLTTRVRVGTPGRHQWLDLFGEQMREVPEPDPLELPAYTTRVLRVAED